MVTDGTLAGRDPIECDDQLVAFHPDIDREYVVLALIECEAVNVVRDTSK